MGHKQVKKEAGKMQPKERTCKLRRTTYGKKNKTLKRGGRRRVMDGGGE